VRHSLLLPESDIPSFSEFIGMSVRQDVIRIGRYSDQNV
jgi:hypothetical protein